MSKTTDNVERISDNVSEKRESLERTFGSFGNSVGGVKTETVNCRIRSSQTGVMFVKCHCTYVPYTV